MKGYQEGKSLFTLKDGTKKWMTKKEFTNYLAHIESLKTQYEEFLKEGYITDDMSTNEKVHVLVDLGDSLMDDICGNADYITITGYNRIKNEVSNKISKPVFVEFVKFYAKHLSKDSQENMSDTKITEKLLKDIDESVYKINLRKLFYLTFINEKQIVIPSGIRSESFPSMTATKSKKFKEILISCAQTRRYIDDELWTMYHGYADIAEYVTSGEISYEKYKQLVDYQHYMKSTDSRFDKIDKKWQKLYDIFVDKYRLCKKFGYGYFDSIEEEINKLKEVA